MRYINVDRMVELRKARGWAQRQLAKEAGITHTIISRLEARTQDDVKLSVIIAIAKALEVAVDSLLVDSRLTLETELVPELQVMIQRLKRRPEAVQRQAAGILGGFLDVVEKK